MLVRITSLLLLLPLFVFADSRLSGHPSPYLQSHADDVIQWRIPGPDALAEAQRSNLPLFISSGYLACYWCHRLKTESFQDQTLGSLVNAAFVPVLLDREIHGEDDRRLQDMMQGMLGFSGWPVMMVMTPNQIPIKAWPYTAADTLLQDIETIADAWSQDADSVAKLAQEFMQQSLQAATAETQRSASSDLGVLLSAFLDQTGNASDSEYGGFGREAKYPYIPQLQVLLDLNQLNPSEAMTAFLRHSLDTMAAGELIDPVERGVFRYTENVDWTAPHFEQMLYTQAQVARLYIRASSALAQPGYLGVARGILDNMTTRFGSDEDAWFVASLSAMGEDGVNGGYYLFSEQDLIVALGDNWRSRVTIRRQYGDRLLVAPHGPLAMVTGQALVSLRTSSPLQRDDKRLLAWNGLALSALSHGAALDESYRSAAADLAAAIRARIDDTGPGQLADYPARIVPPDLDALVYPAAGLLDWWQVTGDASVVADVIQLLEFAQAAFYASGEWSRSRPLLFANAETMAAIPDDQLPSPSAEWLRVAVTLQAAGIPLPDGVSRVADEMAVQWPQSVNTAAFFNATLVGALVTRRFVGIH